MKDATKDFASSLKNFEHVTCNKPEFERKSEILGGLHKFFRDLNRTFYVLTRGKFLNKY